MRVAIVGANGQFGRDLVKAFVDHDVIAWTRNDFDVREHGKASQAIVAAAPEVVVTTAAFHNPDACEENTDLAFAVNSVAVRNMADACQRCRATLVYISTDYVFDGQKGDAYTEQDCPNPINVYGTSKLAGEFSVAATCDRYYIIRVAALFGVAGGSSKPNFVERMLSKARSGERLVIVNDVVTSPTYTADAAGTIRGLIEGRAPSGIYHVTNAGACSWYGFAAAILHETGIAADLRSTTLAALAPKAARPKYSALTTTRLAASNLPLLRPWREALAECLKVQMAEAFV